MFINIVRENYAYIKFNLTIPGTCMKEDVKGFS